MEDRMSVLRTKSVGTKVTADEYAKLEVLAGTQSLSEWTRDVLLKAAAPDPAIQLLAELLALRTILLNVHFTISSGGALSVEQMQLLIERADQDKIGRAHERLAAVRGAK
jgi:hypothetical protein